jgi:copper(I)-binding protein
MKKTFLFVWGLRRLSDLFCNGCVFETASKLSIEAIGRRRRRPDEYQVTMERLTRPLGVGEHVLLTLIFERAGRIKVSAHVSNQMLGNR